MMSKVIHIDIKRTLSGTANGTLPGAANALSHVTVAHA